MSKTLFRTRSAVLAALVAFTAACGDGAGGTAATVNGVDISVSEVEAMRISEAATIDKIAFAEDLTNAIINVAVVTAARDEFSIEPTTEEIAVKKEELASTLEAAQGISIEDFFETQGLPIERLDVIANQQVIRELLFVEFESEALPATDADARLLLSADPNGRVTACVRHILVPTEQEAIDARSRIDGGEAFADVAAEIGTDGTAASGGDLGCQPLGMYVAEFANAAAAATIGAVSDPVESQFGWHLILVESREEPSLESLRDEIDAGRVNQLIDAWLLGIVTDATVEVDDQYGVWVTEPNPMVQAPSS
ncbi:MAG TPA: peptidylprolyl isomerase [Acidimicrobiia bacterium]|nr:peptidylprolyl isomerase [Acidimicrobiia bacterium]